MSVNFTVEMDWSQVDAALTAMGAAATDQLEAALLVAGAVVVNAAQEKVPKATSVLSDSITAITAEKTATMVRVEVGPQVDYGLYVEFGTGIHAENGDGRQTPWVFRGSDGHFYWTQGVKPRPYLRPAFTENRDAAQEAFRLALKGLLGL